MAYSRGKRAAAVLLAAVMILGTGFTSFAQGWQQDHLGWWYENADGSYPISTWYEDEDGSWYFFNEQGYMISNCYRLIDGSFYAFGNDGKWNGCIFSDIYPGVWTGNNYSNDWSGLHLNVPENFRRTTAMDSGRLGESNNFVEFVLWTPDGTGSGIELEYLDAYNFSKSAETSLDSIVTLRGLRLILEGYTIDEITEVILGGKTYAKLSANLEGVLKQDLYCRKVGTHYFECISAIYEPFSEPYIQMLLAGIY